MSRAHPNDLTSYFASLLFVQPHFLVTFTTLVPHLPYPSQRQIFSLQFSQRHLDSRSSFIASGAAQPTTRCCLGAMLTVVSQVIFNNENIFYSQFNSVSFSRETLKRRRRRRSFFKDNIWSRNKATFQVKESRPGRIWFQRVCQIIQ